MKVMVSGLINMETTLKVEGFPIPYYPISYPFYGIHSDVAGVAYNITKALRKLGDSVEIFSFLGQDEEGKRILQRLQDEEIASDYLMAELDETPSSVVLYDSEGRRQIYCDLKNIQEKQMETEESSLARLIESSDLVAACNINFNRPLIKKAKELGKKTATDVHVISDIEDSFNREFMEYADILFLSDESLPCKPEHFIEKLKNRYSNEIIVVGMGRQGAMLYDRQEDKIYQFEAVTCKETVNTVGAGDALFSGFLHFYMKGYCSTEALMRAEIFASFKIGYNGAANGFCDEEKIEEIFAQKKPAICASIILS